MCFEFRHSLLTVHCLLAFLETQDTGVLAGSPLFVGNRYKPTKELTFGFDLVLI